MEFKIKNLRPEWSIAKDEFDNLYAYDTSKYHLLPEAEKPFEVSVYPMGNDGIINYDYEINLSSHELKPQWIRLI